MTLIEHFREWIGFVGFKVFLWAIRLKRDKYIDAVIRESGLTVQWEYAQPRCPRCKYFMPFDAVICTHCGWHPNIQERAK